MNFYKSITAKILKYFSIIFSIIILLHIIISLLIRNTMTYTTIIMYTLVLTSTTIIILLIIFLKKSLNKTNILYKYFLDDCDLVKALEVVNENIEDSLNKNTKINMTSIKLMILFKLKKYEEAKQILNLKIETTNQTTLILWEHNKNMIYTALNDSNIESMQESFLNMVTRCPKKEYFIKAYHNAQIKYYYFINYKFDGLEEFYEDELKHAASLMEKVSFNANLAKIYVFNKQISKAKEAIDFVIKNGNTMSAVEECKILLDKIGEQYEKNI